MRDDPKSRVEALDRILVEHPLDSGGRMYYGGSGKATRLLCGGFALEETAPSAVVDLLPDVLRIDGRSDRAGSWVEAMFSMLQEQAADSSPGAKAVFAKIADVFLTQALRTFLTGIAERGVLEMEALSDPAIAEALYLIRSHPEHNWSVGQLAHRVGMSRSGFSDRFRYLTGQPPMRYVTKTRLTRAAGLLATTRRSLASIATECGYESDASFSKAFKREFVVTPGQYREKASRRPPLTVAAG
jgi:AraC-like DNA-binding protein